MEAIQTGAAAGAEVGPAQGVTACFLSKQFAESSGQELDREGKESAELSAQLAELQKHLDEFDVSTDSSPIPLPSRFGAKVLAGAYVVA